MKLKVISSSKKVYESEEIQEINVPTINGRIGILPGHINLIIPLEIGNIKVKKGDTVEKILLNGGMLQIADNEILILADEANLSDKLVKEEIKEAIKNAEENIATSELDPAELIQLEKKLRYEKFKEKQLVD